MTRVIVLFAVTALLGCDYFGPDVAAGNWVSTETYLTSAGTAPVPLRLSIASNSVGALSGQGSIGSAVVSIENGTLDRTTGDVSMVLRQFGAGATLAGSVNRSGTEILGVLNGVLQVDPVGGADYVWVGATVTLRRQ
jgi:hypothetical protein